MNRCCPGVDTGKWILKNKQKTQKYNLDEATN